MSGRDALARTILLTRDGVSGAISDDEILGRLQSFVVRCVADRANLSTYAGQVALTTFITLAARLGVQIVLDAPDVELIGSQPPLRGRSLVQALVDLGEDLIPGSAISAATSAAVNWTVALGDTPCTDPGATTRLVGGDFRGELIGGRGPGRRWDAQWTVGAMTAAVLAAGEIYKAAIRTLPLINDIWYEFLAPVADAAWDFGPCPRPCRVGPSQAVDVISAGAIAQAALYALSRLPVSLAIRLIDPDSAGLSNLNRQLLLRRSNAGLKVDVVARALAGRFRVEPTPRLFTPQFPERNGGLADHVLVGVDLIPVRWQVQRANPRWLGVGATSHFGVMVSSHERGQPCAGCLHPTDDPNPHELIPTVSFVSFWAGLALAVRFVREMAGAPYAVSQQQMWIDSLRAGEGKAVRLGPVAARRDCPVQCTPSRAALSPAA